MTSQSASPTGVENRWYGPSIRMFFVTAISRLHANGSLFVT